MIWHWNHQVQGTPGHRKISVGISFPMTISNFLSFSTRILTHKSICSEQWWSPDKYPYFFSILRCHRIWFFDLARFRLYFLNSNLQNYGSLQHKGFQFRKIFFISAFWFEFFFWNSTKWNNVACFLSGSTVFFVLSILILWSWFQSQTRLPQIQEIMVDFLFFCFSFCWFFGGTNLLTLK